MAGSLQRVGSPKKGEDRQSIKEGGWVNEDWFGGSPRQFERAGREQLIVLLESGLTSKSKVLDVGCGALRGGRWIMPLLDPGNYCGIEPNQAMLNQGLRDFVPPEIVALKGPRFDHNDSFDFSVFGTSFTHVIARSVWTHASKSQIELMLDGFVGCSEPQAVFLASFIPVSRFASLPSPVRAIPYRLGYRPRTDYTGELWRGRSHEQDTRSLVAHRYSWIQSACRSRELDVTTLDRPAFGTGQIWAAVRRSRGVADPPQT